MRLFQESKSLQGILRGFPNLFPLLPFGCGKGLRCVPLEPLPKTTLVLGSLWWLECFLAFLEPFCYWGDIPAS
jgi:hypothetical protein